ncbi:MAG: amidohydrolase [Alphaproteobacteria bacterium]|nr:amidohydrolase [Alphaproteobacteria bacterium]
MAQRWDGSIVDAHHHFWDPAVNYHPWLAPGVKIAFRYGDYEALKRRYLLDEYQRDAAGHDIVQSVYVETEWDPKDPIGETRYATSLKAQGGRPNAIVAQAWLDRDDVAEVLAGQAKFPLVRSVRHKPGGPAERSEVGTARTKMSDETWRSGYALLAKHGLHFDLQTPWWNLPEAEDLARDFPGTTIILNHSGLPAQRDEESLHAWRDAMARFARCPNVVVKLSGMGVPGQPWLTDSTRWIVRTAIDLFGAERTMFGSNFPVDSLCASFDAILSGFKTILAPLPEKEQAAFFNGTARRVYRPAG